MNRTRYGLTPRLFSGELGTIALTSMDTSYHGFCKLTNSQV